MFDIKKSDSNIICQGELLRYKPGIEKDFV